MKSKKLQVCNRYVWVNRPGVRQRYMQILRRSDNVYVCLKSPSYIYILTYSCISEWWQMVQSASEEGAFLSRFSFHLLLHTYNIFEPCKSWKSSHRFAAELYINIRAASHRIPQIHISNFCYVPYVSVMTRHKLDPTYILLTFHILHSCTIHEPQTIKVVGWGDHAEWQNCTCTEVTA